MPTTITLQKQQAMLKLMYITNRPEIAHIAKDAGVDRIFVDLEVLDKAKRQGGMDTVQSHHTLDDVKRMRNAFDGELLVRCNHIYDGSREEIDTIIANGADIVMLPYFKTVNEAAKFIDIVDGRAKTNLLVETADAVKHIDSILDLNGIDEIHVGLNDLHLDYGMKFMFELLADGTVERLARKVLSRGIKFGFGGIAKLGYGALPAEMVIKEHYRIGSTCAILSRSFCNTDTTTDLNEVKQVFTEELGKIRQLEREAQVHRKFFTDNTSKVENAVNAIVSK